jgi:hypothetical protein
VQSIAIHPTVHPAILLLGRLVLFDVGPAGPRRSLPPIVGQTKRSGASALSAIEASAVSLSRWVSSCLVSSPPIDGCPVPSSSAVGAGLHDHHPSEPGFALTA